MNHPLDKPRESKDDVFDADGNKIVYRDPPTAAAVAVPAPAVSHRNRGS